MQDFREYVQAIVNAWRDASKLQPRLQGRRELESLPPDAPRILIFAPHPDDEIIIGALPLRLLRQSGIRVVNIAVTLGSNKGRQLERQEEVRAACAYMGFDCITADECGLENINLRARRDEPIRWVKAADVLAHLLDQLRPIGLFYPHASDANSTHMGVHGLVNHALIRVGEGFSCHCFETEFWSPMETPNLMVESSMDDVADLVSALSLHKGEVSRNPYHLSLPAWMMDNVRRGAERVGGQGKTAPAFRFATLYRVRHWSGKRFDPVQQEGRFLSLKDNPAALFRRDQP